MTADNTDEVVRDDDGHIYPSVKGAMGMLLVLIEAENDWGWYTIETEKVTDRFYKISAISYDQAGEPHEVYNFKLVADE